MITNDLERSQSTAVHRRCAHTHSLMLLAEHAVFFICQGRASTATLQLLSLRSEVSSVDDRCDLYPGNRIDHLHLDADLADVCRSVEGVGQRIRTQCIFVSYVNCDEGRTQMQNQGPRLLYDRKTVLDCSRDGILEVRRKRRAPAVRHLRLVGTGGHVDPHPLHDHGDLFVDVLGVILLDIGELFSKLGLGFSFPCSLRNPANAAPGAIFFSPAGSDFREQPTSSANITGIEHPSSLTILV